MNVLVKPCTQNREIIIRGLSVHVMFVKNESLEYTTVIFIWAQLLVPEWIKTCLCLLLTERELKWKIPSIAQLTCQYTENWDISKRIIYWMLSLRTFSDDKSTCKCWFTSPTKRCANLSLFAKPISSLHISLYVICCFGCVHT